MADAVIGGVLSFCPRRHDVASNRPKWRTFYHYTNEAGAVAINNSRKIKPTRTSFFGPVADQALGQGVYVTDLSPHCFNKVEILLNNYTHTGFEDKADYCCMITIDENEWIIKSPAPGRCSRNIYAIVGKWGEARDVTIKPDEAAAPIAVRKPPKKEPEWCSLM